MRGLLTLVLSWSLLSMSPNGFVLRATESSSILSDLNKELRDIQFDYRNEEKLISFVNRVEENSNELERLGGSGQRMMAKAKKFQRLLALKSGLDECLGFDVWKDEEFSFFDKFTDGFSFKKLLGDKILGGAFGLIQSENCIESLSLDENVNDLSDLSDTALRMTLRDQLAEGAIENSIETLSQLGHRIKEKDERIIDSFCDETECTEADKSRYSALFNKFTEQLQDSSIPRETPEQISGRIAEGYFKLYDNLYQLSGEDRDLNATEPSGTFIPRHQFSVSSSDPGVREGDIRFATSLIGLDYEAQRREFLADPVLGFLKQGSTHFKRITQVEEPVAIQSQGGESFTIVDNQIREMGPHFITNYFNITPENVVSGKNEIKDSLFEFMSDVYQDMIKDEDRNEPDTVEKHLVKLIGMNPMGAGKLLFENPGALSVYCDIINKIADEKSSDHWIDSALLVGGILSLPFSFGLGGAGLVGTTITRVAIGVDVAAGVGYLYQSIEDYEDRDFHFSVCLIEGDQEACERAANAESDLFLAGATSGLLITPLAFSTARLLSRTSRLSDLRDGLLVFKNSDDFNRLRQLNLDSQTHSELTGLLSVTPLEQRRALLDSLEKLDADEIADRHGQLRKLIDDFKTSCSQQSM